MWIDEDHYKLRRVHGKHLHISACVKLVAMMLIQCSIVGICGVIDDRVSSQDERAMLTSRQFIKNILFI